MGLDIRMTAKSGLEARTRGLSTLIGASASMTAKYDDLLSAGLAIQPRWGTPEDVGRAVAALVRGDFPYSSGSVFMIDGGMAVQRL